ncbi:MAG: helix-turn-helix domain-containing protein [Candidatus Marinimicrobia bacterium]|nr:helix-turn-helix domain-containing protein [Candidatus Neomarinimicrobiota bacterium]
MEKLFRYRDAAQHLGVSERSIQRWIMQKDVQTVRLGRCVRIPESEMEKFIDKEFSLQDHIDKFLLEED